MHAHEEGTNDSDNLSNSYDDSLLAKCNDTSVFQNIVHGVFSDTEWFGFLDSVTLVGNINGRKVAEDLNKKVHNTRNNTAMNARSKNSCDINSHTQVLADILNLDDKDFALEISSILKASVN